VDVWITAKVALLFSNVPNFLWDESWLNAGYVKRHLPSTANEELKSRLHIITGNQVSLGHLLPFGSLLYIAKEQRDNKEPKFDIRDQAPVCLRHSLQEGLKCLRDTLSISSIRVVVEKICKEHILIQILHMFHSEMLVTN
jgi:hypothetical protein